MAVRGDSSNRWLGPENPCLFLLKSSFLLPFLFSDLQHVFPCLPPLPPLLSLTGIYPILSWCQLQTTTVSKIKICQAIKEWQTEECQKYASPWVVRRVEEKRQNKGTKIDEAEWQKYCFKDRVGREGKTKTESWRPGERDKEELGRRTQSSCSK